MLSPSSTIPIAPPTAYVPRGTNTLRLIFHDHFPAFAHSYDSLYAQDYGKFRLERISHVVDRFESCGDYTKGIARIQCSNPACRLEYFRPFSCKGFYLCPSFSQKRTLLFASVSSLIFSLIRELYRLAAGSPCLTTAAIIAFHPFGDFLRPNAHWHALVLEGGFAPDRRFLFLPIHDTQKLSEAFHRALMKLFLSKDLVTEEFASTLLCWKHSGFSVDNRVRIGAEDHTARVAMAQYIARAPLALEKLSYLPSQGKVSYTSDFNPANGDTIKVWDARDFIAAATLFIPPQGVRLIRYFGLVFLP